MQLFQEYVVGKVSRSPHMFSVTSGDITFLKQFPAEYWVDALWQRYNPILFGALKKREKQRKEAGYDEFVKAKYHQILDSLTSNNLDIKIKKKKALLQALNLAEEKYTYINVKNMDHIWFLKSLIYEEGSPDKKSIIKKFKGNNYIEELVKSLEFRPMDAKGYDLTGVKEHLNVDENKKSKYSSRGFQFPSRNVIRKSLKRWIEYLGADLLNTTKIPENEKKDFTHIKGNEINDLYEKHWRHVYFKFFIELGRSKDLEDFGNQNRDALINILKILENESINELTRSNQRFQGVIEFVKTRILTILQPATMTQGLRELSGYLKNRSHCTYLAEVLSKTELRIARKNKTFIDPHDRMPGYDPDTNTDERLHPKVKMIKVKVKEQDTRDTSKYIEKTIEVPDLQRGRTLYPIHDMPEEQDKPGAVGSFHRYEDLHSNLPQKQKTKPFKIVSQEDLRLKPEMKKKRIIAGGLVPNQDSPYRSSILAKEDEFVNKIEDIRRVFRFQNYKFERNEDNVLNPIQDITGSFVLSQFIVDYLRKKLKANWREQVSGHEAQFEWKKWAKCLNENSYKKLHDHCVEILSDNYEEIISKEASEKIRKRLDYLFQRISQLNFGSGTFKKRNKKITYNCVLINDIVERFYSGDTYDATDIASSSREAGRRHDVSNRASYQRAAEEADATPNNWLQLFRQLANAYMPKFSGVDARSSAELCTSSFMKGIVSSGQDLEIAVNAEIARLAKREEKPNCEIEETRSIYKKALEILDNIVRNGFVVILPQEIETLEKLTNQNTSHYNTKIEKLVKLLKERTTALTELFSAINSYNQISDVNLSNVVIKIATIKNMNFDGFIVSDAIRQAASEILDKKKKMNTLTVKIPNYDIKRLLNRIVSDRK
jgi:hypothetical protein